MPKFTQIAYEQHDATTIIRFNRPEVRNCIEEITHRELVEAWDLFRDDDEAKVAIITGTGDKAFCSGGDLKSFVGRNPDYRPSVIAAHARGERPGALGPSRWADIYKPIIAAVNGVAYAGGLEWVCLADTAAIHGSRGGRHRLLLSGCVRSCPPPKANTGSRQWRSVVCCPHASMIMSDLGLPEKHVTCE